MANSIIRSVASGTTAVFPVSCPYLDKSHITVYLDGVLLDASGYTWPSMGQIQLTAGNPAEGTIVERRRVTPTEPLTTFSPGNLDTTDLNVASLQPLYVAEEARDALVYAQQEAFKATYGNIGPTMQDDIPDGSALVKVGDTLVAGPNADQIANAAQDADDAADALAAALVLVGDLTSLQAAVLAAQEAANAAAASALEAAGAVSAFVIGGYGSTLPDTRTWLSYIYANTLAEPRDDITKAYNSCIEELLDGGAWPLLDSIYTFRTYDEAVACRSLKNPSLRPILLQNGLTLTLGQGFKGDAISKHIQIAGGPAAFPSFLRNGGTVGGMSTGGTTTGNLLSTTASTATSGFGLAPAGPTGNFNLRLQNTTVYAAAAAQERSGHWTAVRESDTILKGYREAALVGTGSVATVVDPSTAALTLLRSSSTYEDDMVHAFYVGGVMTADHIACIHSALSTLHATIGVS